jgi:GNAT superfamily N-acetyltransferase
MAQPGSAGQRQADLAVTTIRRARPAEAQRLSEIALAAKASWGYPASFMARCRAALVVDPKRIIERQFHLAEDEDGTILGFYGFEPEHDGIGLSHLFVVPEAAGHGTGRALWRHAAALAQRLGQAQLLVVSDPHAAGFYARMGAQPAGARPSEIDPARPLPMFRLRLDGAAAELSDQTLDIPVSR